MIARRFFALAAVAVTALAFVTRADQSLSYDELFTIWVSSRPAADLTHQANQDGFTPPLFYALVKLVSLAGLTNESLRVLPVLLGGLSVYLGLLASTRIFGPAAGWPAILVVPTSAYLFSFSHELRPYSALLCCAFVFLGQLGGPTDEESDGRAAVAALAATAVSYLGVVMVMVWLFECRNRVSSLHRLGVILISVVMSAAGLLKAFTLAVTRIDSTIAWSAPRPALSTLWFGLAPMPFDSRVEGASLVLLAALLVVALLSERSGPLKFPARAFVAFTLAVFALDALVPVGFAPRYFALSMSAMLLLLVGLLARFGRRGVVVALLILVLNGFSIFRYLTSVPPPREDWREAMSRIEKRLGPKGTLLAFPFHHAAVAGHAYAPGLAIGGGYTSRTGPTFWYEPPATFAGYSFSSLARIDDPRSVFARVAGGTDVCLLTDEPDVRKTAALFAVFETLGRVEPFDTGDPRLRARCRGRD